MRIESLLSGPRGRCMLFELMHNAAFDQDPALGAALSDAAWRSDPHPGTRLIAWSEDDAPPTAAEVERLSTPAPIADGELAALAAAAMDIDVSAVMRMDWDGFGPLMEQVVGNARYWQPPDGTDNLLLEARPDAPSVGPGVRIDLRGRLALASG